MDLKLAGKVAIVTGGGQGCGRGYCLGFAEEGVRVVVVDINGESAQQVAKQIKTKGGKALAVKTDVSKWEDVSSMAAKALKKFGQIDILVNNAGIRSFALVEEISDEHWDRELNVNLKGAFYCVKAVAAHMKQRRYGKIINQSSSAGMYGHPFRGSSYGAAKAGLLGFSRSMALELGPYNINVNAIVPSSIRTAFTANLPPEVLEAQKRNSVFKRLAEVDDFVGLVLFLASDRSSFITGQTIVVSGGQHIT